MGTEIDKNGPLMLIGLSFALIIISSLIGIAMDEKKWRSEKLKESGRQRGRSTSDTPTTGNDKTGS